MIDAQCFQEPHRRQWRRQTVNFRYSQYKVLDRLAEELNLSVSCVTRKIVAEFIEGLNGGGESPTWVRGDDSVITKSFGELEDSVQRCDGDRWVRQTVNLRTSQFDFLLYLSLEAQLSVSGVTREIVRLFIESPNCKPRVDQKS